MDPLISAQCLDYDPPLVLVTFHFPTGDQYFTFNESDYQTLALASPIFPPDPCAGA